MAQTLARGVFCLPCPDRIASHRHKSESKRVIISQGLLAALTSCVFLVNKKRITRFVSGARARTLGLWCVSHLAHRSEPRDNVRERMHHAIGLMLDQMKCDSSGSPEQQKCCIVVLFVISQVSQPANYTYYASQTLSKLLARVGPLLGRRSFFI